MFHADWCPYCIDFMPIFDEVATILHAEGIEVSLAAIDASMYTETKHAYNIEGYPTFKLFANGVPTADSFSHGDSVEEMVAKIENAGISGSGTTDEATDDAIEEEVADEEDVEEEEVADEEVEETYGEIEPDALH